MAADDVRAMSEALAADPQSLVFLPLGEALLARGDLTQAARVAQRGAVRHQSRADAHDLVARIALAQGDDERAEVAWETVLTLRPDFGTAHRGIGFLRYRQGKLDDARRHLEAARADDPGDQAVLAALNAVRRAMGEEPEEGPRGADGRSPSPSASLGAVPEGGPDGPSAAEMFDAILGDTAQVALLLDADGFVTAGRYVTAEGNDLGAVIGAHLSGVSDEAERAMRHFGLGRWTRIVLETEAATVAMAPHAESVVLIAAPRGTPLGFVRRTLDRCAALVREWLGRGA